MSLLATETTKQFRRPRTYIALGLMVVIPLIVTFAVHENPPSEPGGQGNGFFYLTSQFSGLLMAAAALEFMSRFLLVAVVAMFAGEAIAGEASWGNLRALLMRPVRRTKLVLAKLAVVVLLTLSATALITVAGLVAGWIAFGWHPLDLPFRGMHQSTGELLGNVGLSTAYVAVEVMGIAGIGFMMSTMTDSPMGAATAAFGVYATSAILDGVEAIGRIRNVFPTHYFDAWHALFTGGDTSDMARGVVLQLGYLALGILIGLWWFCRKDVLS